MERSAQTSSTPVVVAQQLTKVFKDFWMRDRVRAVDALDLEIRPGQIFGLIGPNGSGKSTTIKMILGLLHKTGGRLAVFGKPPTDTSVKSRIGYLPEESYLYPFLNPRETLDFYGRLFGLPSNVRQRRVDELLEMVGLDAVQHRPVGEFSKGMQRRVGLAQALINDPEFLILDEPTSGLDPIGMRQVKDLILELRKRGKTILLSSHMLSEVEDVCDYMCILYGGKKRAEGNRDELLLAHDRMVIETEPLTDGQAAEMARLIEERSGRRVLRMSPARENLESLFLKIVAQAQAERAVTHGARSGGPTAAFLRGDGEADRVEGEELISKLVAEPADETTPGPKPQAANAEPARAGPDESVLESLVHGEEEPAEAIDRDGRSEPTAAPAGRSEASAPKPTEVRESDVDHGVIDSLLGGASDEESRP